MPVLVLIFTGLVALVSLIMIITGFAPFLRQRRAQLATPTKAANVSDGSVVLRGKVKAASASEMRSWITGEEIVWRRLEVIEMVGKRRCTALNQVEAREFLLDDGSGKLALIRLGVAPIDNAEIRAVRWNKMSEALQDHASQYGSFRWPKTPKTAFEYMLPVERVVTATGIATTGSKLDPQTDLSVDVMTIAIYGKGLMGTAEGRSFVWSIVAFLAGSAASLGCLAWGGWL
jgi:hypothetical protein